MIRTRAALRPSELSDSTLPRFRDGLVAAEAAGVSHRLRSYPGTTRIALARPSRRLFESFDAVVERRRSARALDTRVPTKRELSRVLHLGHGVTGEDGRGPAPSAGNLQPIELYLLVMGEGWLRPSAYHYDRGAHALCDLEVEIARERLEPSMPSFRQVDGGAIVLVLAGDTRAVDRKYGDRAPRFLLLEAGAVMHSLALAAASVGACVVPVGGFLEAPLARMLRLPEYDAVLYCGLLGYPR